jgi:hypothetical protein
MLTGEKGSGKSLLAKTISMEGNERGIPTIIINAPWHGDAFNSLIQSIEQPAVILFDEFEKVYDSEQQEKILTLLDGVFPTQKLFVFTCNDKWRVDQHMRNRPGRIFYMLDFSGLEPAFIEEYCNDNLNAKEYIPVIVKLSTLFAQFNFDMLKSLIEEMNRYDEAPTEALRMLNVRPEFDNGKVAWTMNLTDTSGAVMRCDRPEFVGNPLTLNLLVYYKTPDAKVSPDEDDEDNWENVMFTHAEMRNAQSNSYTFVSGDLTLVLTKKEAPKAINWMDAL